jgi:hypothetical protein
MALTILSSGNPILTILMTESLLRVCWASSSGKTAKTAIATKNLPMRSSPFSGEREDSLSQSFSLIPGVAQVYSRLCTVNYASPTDHLQTPHFPPCFAQWAQYLQFLQALHGSLPVQVAKEASAVITVTTAKTATRGQIRNSRCIFGSPFLMGKIVLHFRGCSAAADVNAHRCDRHQIRVGADHNVE